MFVEAVKIASAYTYPVIISKRLTSGKVECGCASFIILNSDGWALTASHVLNDLQLFEQNIKQLEESEKLKS